MLKIKEYKNGNQINKKPDLGDLLLHLRRNILESVKKKGLKTDLTFSQMEILHFVGPAGQKTMKNVADYLKITPPSVTGMIREMERKNLVRRGNDKQDRRIVYITLTAPARRNYVAISRDKEQILNHMVAGLSPRDKKNLERIIKIITKA